jgi:hypothetical protein
MAIAPRLIRSPATQQFLLGQSLSKQAADQAGQPVYATSQGLARIAQALGGALLQNRAQKTFKEEQAADAANLASMLGGAGFTSGEAALFASELPGARDAGAAQFAARRATELENLKAQNRPPKYENVVRNGVPTRMTAREQQAAIDAGDTITPFTSPGTVVNVNEGDENPGDKKLAEAAAQQIIAEQGEIAADQDIAFRLDMMSELLDPERELDTGAFAEMLMPVRSILRDLNLLSAEDARNFDDQQIFKAAANFIVPRMRVAGSGASSDFEQRLFASATAGLGNTPEANRVLVAGMRALYRNKRRVAGERAQYYRRNNGDMSGFQQYMEDNHVPLFEYVDPNKSRKNSVDERGFLDAINAGRVNFGDLYYHAASKQFRVLNQQDITDLNEEFGD